MPLMGLMLEFCLHRVVQLDDIANNQCWMALFSHELICSIFIITNIIIIIIIITVIVIIIITIITIGNNNEINIIIQI